MGVKGGLYLIVQLAKEVGGEGGRLHSRVDCLNAAIQHNFHSLLSPCCVSGVYRQFKRKRGLHLSDVIVSFSRV